MLILVYHPADPARAGAILAHARAAWMEARVVGRNGDAWDGTLERVLGHRCVDAIAAPEHPAIAAAHLAAGLTILEVPDAVPETDPSPVADGAPPQSPAPPAPAPPAKPSRARR